jgi:hypothetical protein
MNFHQVLLMCEMTVLKLGCNAQKRIYFMCVCMLCVCIYVCMYVCMYAHTPRHIYCVHTCVTYTCTKVQAMAFTFESHSLHF